MNISALIEKYIETVSKMKRIGQSHGYSLRMLQAHPIGQVDAEKLKASDVLAHAQLRRQTVSAATVAQDICYLRGPLDYATIGFDMPLVNSNALRDAKPLLEKFQLTGKSRPRDRRPTQDEQDRLLAYFRERAGQCAIPMHIVCEFQILSCRRISETCSMTWGKVDMVNRTALITNMKDPRNKIGNNHRFALLGRAWDLVMQQPRLTNDPDERVFPYNSKSVSASYTRAKKALGIENLHLHDSRREGASKLFEAGYGVPEVMVQTGHKSPSMLMRVYTKLNAADLHSGPASRHE